MMSKDFSATNLGGAGRFFGDGLFCRSGIFDIFFFGDFSTALSEEGTGLGAAAVTFGHACSTYVGTGTGMLAGLDIAGSFGFLGS